MIHFLEFTLRHQVTITGKGDFRQHAGETAVWFYQGDQGFGRKVDAFQDSEWETDDPHLVCYLKQYGAGEVLYLTLGHCRSTYDMQPLVEEYPAIERCSWELPVYYELLRRGINWGIGAS